MTWLEYTNLLIPLAQKFGKQHISLSKQNVAEGFQRVWRYKTKDDLMTLINEAISSGVMFSLRLEPKSSLIDSVSTQPNLERITTSPSRRIYQHEEITGISDEYLNNYLNQNGVKSLLELLEKTKEELRKRAE